MYRTLGKPFIIINGELFCLLEKAGKITSAKKFLYTHLPSILCTYYVLRSLSFLHLYILAFSLSHKDLLTRLHLNGSHYWWLATFNARKWHFHAKHCRYTSRINFSRRNLRIYFDTLAMLMIWDLSCLCLQLF